MHELWKDIQKKFQGQREEERDKRRVLPCLRGNYSIELFFVPAICIYYGHYTRIAISGDRRDAFQAGNSPANMVTVNDMSHT